ncbi:hypothetical protein HYV84_00770 [Candidatus Woesearchaeota archaeon]|nr:hypothetical protein [Candidatus Woesearchaeota archaeon]
MQAPPHYSPWDDHFLFFKPNVIITADHFLIRRGKDFLPLGYKDVFRVFLAEGRLTISKNKEQARTFELSYGDDPSKMPKEEILYPIDVPLRTAKGFVDALKKAGFEEVPRKAPRFLDYLMEFRWNGRQAE